MRKLPEMSVKKPVTTLMMMILVMLLGFVSMSMLPVDLYPKMDVPVAIISVNDSGVAPGEIENLITKPIEQAVSTVSNLKNVNSVSREGSSIVIVEFEYGTDMDFATLEMREKVDLVKRMLPDTASAPMVLKLDPNAQPIIQLAITSDMEPTKLQKLVDDEILSKLERIPGVASVNTVGGKEREVKIDVDAEKLNGYGLTLDNLSAILASENLNLPAGNVKKGDSELLVRTMGEFQSIDDIKNIPIVLNNGQVIRLSDIATVNLGFKEDEGYSRLNFANSIGVSITKQSVANTVDVAANVVEEVSKLQTEYPQIKFVVASDSSEFIVDSINSVMRDAVVGGILAVLIIYFFLRNIRSTFVVGMSIPISIIGTFTLMYLMGVTINMISLMGLALAVGMVVDDSIVVLENIYRFREMGYSKIDGAIDGAKEVTVSVVASTLTIIAVFLPFVFVKGFTSIIFKDLSFTVVFSMIISTVVAMTVIPMLSSKILTTHESNMFLLRWFNKFIDKVTDVYKKVIEFVLDHRKLTISTAIIILVASFGLVGMVGGEFFPTQDEGAFTVQIETPYGTELAYADDIVSQVESILKDLPEKDKMFSMVGSTGSEYSMGGSNVSTVAVTLVDKKERNRSTAEIANEVRGKVADIPGANITVSESSSMGGSMGGAPISIEIKGDDLDLLKEVGEDVKGIVSDIPGTYQVETDLKEGDPEARVYINRELAAFYGVSSSDIANGLRSSIEGKEATQFKEDGEEIQVNISLGDDAKSSVENMKQIMITSRSGQSVPLGQISTIEYGNSPTQIVRSNQTRTVTVSSHIQGRDLQSITKDINAKLDSYNFPPGYSYEFGGEQEQMAESFRSLGMALMLSIVIVYMILASQFESLVHPFTIILSVPFSLTGAFIALFISGTPLSVPAMIGLIMLVGIVVKNGIILIDYINVLRSDGVERRDAVIKAGYTRLRPILMTALATILGLLPLMLGLGEGSETQKPLAIVVVGGLIFSTLLTLMFVPVVYTVMDDFINKRKNRKNNRKNKRKNKKEGDLVENK